MAEKSRSADAGQTQASVTIAADELAEDTGAVYEVGFHVVPTVNEAEAHAVLLRLKETLTKGGASILMEEAPKKISFAYRIERSVQGKREKFTEGYFGSIKFEANSAAIKPFEEILRGDREVLRFLLIHTMRESVSATPPRAVFSSDRLEGETIQKHAPAAAEQAGPVSEEELDKSLEALVGE